MVNKEIPPLPICHQVCTWNRPEAIGNHTGKKLECCNSMATENTDKNICLWLHCEIPPRWKQPVSRLSRKTWMPSRQDQTLKTEGASNDKQVTNCQQIQQATQDDDMMALLKHTITFGWTRTVQELPKKLQAYWTFREEMTVEDGLILKATKILIPPSMWESILQQLHDGHLGFTKCYNHAKQTVYWPNLRKELEDLALNCQLCLKHSTAKHKKNNTKLWPRDSSCPLDKTCKWHFPLPEWQLSSYCRLHIKIPCCSQAKIHDSQTCGKSLHPSVQWIWMAKYSPHR